MTTSLSRTCRSSIGHCSDFLEDAFTLCHFFSYSNKVLEVVKSIVQSQDTVPSVIHREMKKEQVEGVRAAKEEVTTGME